MPSSGCATTPRRSSVAPAPPRFSATGRRLSSSRRGSDGPIVAKGRQDRPVWLGGIQWAGVSDLEDDPSSSEPSTDSADLDLTRTDPPPMTDDPDRPDSEAPSPTANG